MATGGLKHTVEAVGPELVIGLVGTIGTDLDRVAQALSRALDSVGYRTDEEPVSLIERVMQFDRWRDLPKTPFDKRTDARMDAGNELRKHLERNDALALLAMAAIRETRKLEGEVDKPISRYAFVLKSLKTPEE